MNNRPWTEFEVAHLHTHYGRETSDKIASHIGRSKAAVQQKARSLDLDLCFQKGPGAPWSNAEIATLRRMRPHCCTQEIAREVGRSRSAVKTKLRDLGLLKYRMTRVQPWSAEDDAILRTAYAEGQKHAVIGLRLNRTKASVTTRAKNLGIQGPPMHPPKPIGSEYLERKTGLRFRKVNDARGCRDANWKRVDVIEWEEINGPLPEGYTLMIINPHMPRTLLNLRLIKKDEVWATASGANLPPEVRELLTLRRQIERQAKGKAEK